MLTLPAVFAALTLQSPATPPTVEWVRRPPVEYPAAALSRSVSSGRVLLNCRFEASVAVDCAVVSETPEGLGFGTEALRAVGRGLATPGTEGQRSVLILFFLG